MASYQVMYWKHIPASVRAWEDQGEVRVEAKLMLPDRFQAAIDAFAMRDGSTDMDSYLDGWAWSEVGERIGTPEQVASALVTELDAEYPRTRLMQPRPEDGAEVPTNSEEGRP